MTAGFANDAERALRGFALGRESWLFAGSARGADRAAFMATVVMSAKLNDVDPQGFGLAMSFPILPTRQSQGGGIASMALEAQNVERSGGLTCDLHRMLTHQEKNR